MTTTKYERARDLYEARESLTADPKVVRLVMKAAQDVADADERVLRYAVEIEARVQRVADHVAKGLHINSLGELQGSAMSFDVACAMREAAVETFKHVAALLADDEAERVTAIVLPR